MFDIYSDYNRLSSCFSNAYNDNQCNVTRMITTEVVMMVGSIVGTMRCFAYVNLHFK